MLNLLIDSVICFCVMTALAEVRRLNKENKELTTALLLVRKEQIDVFRGLIGVAQQLSNNQQALLDSVRCVADRQEAADLRHEDLLQ
jgi:hypothetical protein